jgi:hypothetical protein
MVEICPMCGSMDVIVVQTDLEFRVKTKHYRCGTEHMWKELVLLPGPKKSAPSSPQG